MKLNAPTIKDVARASGVSVGTVSHVLSGRAHVEADTAAKVQRAVAKLGYQKNDTARLLVARKGGHGARTGNLGMLFLGVNPSWHGNPLINSLLEGMQEGAAEAGYHPLVEFVPDPAKLPRSVAAGKIDGAVVRMATGLATWGALEQYRLPLVALGGDGSPAPCPVYIQDDFAAGRECALALWGLGHRRCAFLSTEASHHAFSLRRRGFEQALHEKGCLDPSLVVPGAKREARRDPEAEPPELTAELEMLIERGATALVACNDWAALGIARAAARRGISIPGRISLLSFDNTPGLCQAVEPTLSSYEVPFTRMAADAVRRLATLLGEGPRPVSQETHLLGGRIVWRHSTRALNEANLLPSPDPNTQEP